jgi:hypothetical protein
VEVGEDESVSNSVVFAVATLEDVSVFVLPPLYDAVDTRALDALFAPTGYAAPNEDRTVSFSYLQYEIVVEDGETVTIRVCERSPSGER